ncbi:MAG: M14 family metallopeptidase [Actinobacteria bacterium]|nr:M14 family metallopeptidase [Actinomycetota bacterium]
MRTRLGRVAMGPSGMAGPRLAVVAAGALIVALLSGVAAPSPAPAAQEAQEAPPSTYLVSGVETREQRSAIAGTGAAIDEVRAAAVVVRALPGERDAIATLGYSVEPYKAPVPPPGAGETLFPPGDEAYHDYAETLAEVDAMVAAHPTTVRKFSIGSSYEGRNLVGVRISNDPVDTGSEPGVLFVALHHAREHLTVEVALSLLRLFAESTDPTVRNLVDTRQIYLIPMLNPDGGEFDIASGSYVFWRKNRQPNAGTSERGTDLNRNYGYRWGCCGGSSGNPASETFRGAGPFSSPETNAIRQFVESKRNIRTSISYHSYGDLILYPYGYTFTDLPADMNPVDHNAFVAMAGQMATTTGYTPQQASDLYITDGDYVDWMYGARHIYAFTFELSGSGYGFYPPASLIDEEIAKNRAAALYITQIANCPTAAAGVGCTASSTTSAEPGDTITVSAGGAVPNAAYGLRMSGSFATCANGLRLGGNVTADGAGNIPPTARIIPTNSTSGARYLCFVRQTDPSQLTTPTSLTVI